MSELIGAAETADLLGVDRSRVLKLARAGLIPIQQKLPGRTGAYVFARAAIEELARGRALDDETRAAS
jgi:hypothetical protein